ncbi:DEAD/DEAH box helicase [Corynebacterium sp. H113]|uniref:DEAD/DEAH box helicase n=1 Tax=Corynebacterium sp. H113 TaxID=3133419 RepID=UPI0030B22EF0
MPDFATLGVADPLIRALRGMRVTSPTPIQSLVIPDALARRDVMAQAPTGSGKTIGFGVPLVQLLSGGASKPGRPRAIVLSPTRELADQIADVLADLGTSFGLRVLSLVGGDNVRKQQTLLAAPVDIAVATPGRAHDLKRRGLLHFDDVRIAVVDEADQLAHLGFFADVLGLLRACPHDAQRLLFSATLDDADEPEASEALVAKRKHRDQGEHTVADLMEGRDPSVHRTETSVVSVDAMHHVLLRVRDNEQADAVIPWIASRKGQCVIFANSKARAVSMFEALAYYDIDVDVLHGDRGQTARRKVLADFTAGTTRVLIATDVAARGIDIDSLELVVHADPPLDSATYVHRSGRTARAGKTGTVAMIVRDRQYEQAKNMLAGAGVTAIEVLGTPHNDEFMHCTGARKPRVAARFQERDRDEAGSRTPGNRGAFGRGRGSGGRSGVGSRQHRPKRTKRSGKKGR